MDLFQGTSIGNLTVKNHFLRSATYEGEAEENGKPSENIGKCYQALAEGGVGTIITSYTYIADYEQPSRKQLGIYTDEFIPEYRKITDSVHQRGSKIIMQIVHGSSLSQGYPDKAKILGPSAIPNIHSGIIPREMTKEDIKEVTRLFAAAAVRAKKAGFDGVQIHCAHGYLLAQFISPLFNKRQDEYGGSMEKRFCIVREVYDAVRHAVGREFPVWIKINSCDEQDKGLTVEEFLYMGKELSHRNIDAIEVSGERWNMHKKHERAYYKEAAMALSNLVPAAVILTGGLRSMEDMVPVMENSHVNLFGFSRPFIGNPYFIQTDLVTA